MTAIQIDTLTAQAYRDMGIIAENEGFLQRISKYLRKIVRDSTEDSFEMSQEDKAKQSPGKAFDSVEQLDKYIRSL
ncbi:MAG: hypothetical protein IJT75_02735 [Bacteroidaceae bacterium]|nr:hypothetical protein [Bacteroidaceae bacterium]